MTVAGLVLAGGRSSRMGGADKAFLTLGGMTLLARALARVGPQVDRLWISANGAPGLYAAFDAPLVGDAVEGFAGPLAGVHAALLKARMEGVDRVATIAVDTPFFPGDLVVRLAAGPGDEIAVASSGGRAHPVFALWPVHLVEDLRAALAAGERKAMAFIAGRPHRVVAFPNADGDPFFNINAPGDLTVAEARQKGSA